MKKYLFISILLVLSGQLNAGSVRENCTIAGIRTDPSGSVFLRCIGGTTGTPACNSQEIYYLDMNESGAKNVLSLAMTVYVTGDPVRLIGSGVCTQGLDTIVVLNSPAGW